MMAYRSSVHESTGHSPYRLTFGKEMRLPIDVMYPTPMKVKFFKLSRTIVHDKLLRLANMFDFVREKCMYE